MRKRLGAFCRPPLLIELSGDSVRLLEAGGGPRPDKLLASVPLERGADAAQACSRLSTLLSQHRCAHRVASITVADQWVRLFMVTPPQHPQRLQDCQAAAEMRFQSLYGAPLADWALNADWQAQRDFLACAMPQALLLAVRELAVRHQLTLLTIVPAFVARWNRWYKRLLPGAWFASLHADVLTLAVLDRRGVCGIRSLPVPAQAWQDAQWLPLQMHRTAQLFGPPAAPVLQLCGPLPAGWCAPDQAALQVLQLEAAHNQALPPAEAPHVSGAPRPRYRRFPLEFAPPSVLRSIRRTRPLTWFAGAVGLLLLCSASVALLDLHQLRQARASARLLTQAKLAALETRTSAPPASGITEPEAAAVNAAIAQLNLPWRDLLDAIEAATPAHIALLSLDPAPAKQLVKATAEAKTAEQMIAYVEQLKRQDFFAGVMLTRHEINTQDPQQPVRFQFEAQWREVAR